MIRILNNFHFKNNPKIMILLFLFDVVEVMNLKRTNTITLFELK